MYSYKLALVIKVSSITVFTSVVCHIIGIGLEAYIFSIVKIGYDR